MRTRTPEAWIGPRLEVIDWKTLLPHMIERLHEALDQDGESRLCEIATVVRGVTDGNIGTEVLHLAGYYWDLTEGDVSYFEGLDQAGPEWTAFGR